MTVTFGTCSFHFSIPFPPSTMILYWSGCLGRSDFKIAVEAQGVNLVCRSEASGIRLEVVGSCSRWKGYTSSDMLSR